MSSRHSGGDRNRTYDFGLKTGRDQLSCPAYNKQGYCRKDSIFVLPTELCLKRKAIGLEPMTPYRSSSLLRHLLLWFKCCNSQNDIIGCRDCNWQVRVCLIGMWSEVCRFYGKHLILFKITKRVLQSNRPILWYLILIEGILFIRQLSVSLGTSKNFIIFSSFLNSAAKL